MAWISNNGWVHSSNPDRLYRVSGSGNNSLVYRGASKTFLSNKNYLFRTYLRNISDNPSYPYLDEFTKISNWGDSITYDMDMAKGFDYSLSTGPLNGYVYFYSNPNSNVTTTDYVSYNASASFTASYGILSEDIYEINWILNGYSWIGNGDFNTLPTAFSRCNGWAYDNLSNSFFWFDTEPTTVSGGFPICLSKPPLTNPAGKNGETKGLIDVFGCAPVSPFKYINSMYRFVNYQFFNFEFNLTKYHQFTKNDPDAGINIYLSDTEPYTGTSKEQFDSYLAQSDVVASNLNVDGTYSFFGLQGNRYLFIVGDIASATYSANTQLKISNIKVEGGYHPSNNNIYQVTAPGISFDPNQFIGATYSSFAGSGNSIDNNKLGLTVSSKIGNGTFKAGIWENGSWNNGWRKDTEIIELHDIIESVRIFSDVLWRIRISGLTSEINNLKIGDNISIGNIIAIDINENRKILKDYYRIINIKQIDNRLSYIEVNIKTQFPNRRIEKDSETHRIRATKNIWLYGAFLNGYFEGIWNDGLFKGYPLITEMYNTNWINGSFEGGHFNSNYYILGSFSQTFRDINFKPAKVGFTTTQPHNLKVGDVVEISKNDININPNYNGESVVIKVTSDNQFVIDKTYEKLLTNPESGSFFTKVKNGIVQNVIFDSKNASNITSIQSMASTSVFIYNSWMDVVYNNESAVNIGKNQNILDTISRKTFSENNLYGYPTDDILSSVSKFRDSYSTNTRLYNLGSKYRVYEDFIGESSVFTEYFGATGSDSQLFIEQGWTYSNYQSNTISFSRTEMLGQSLIAGDELKVDSTKKGGVLDITPREVNLTKSRYSIVEFDLIKFESGISPTFSNDIANNFLGLNDLNSAYYNVIPAIGSKIKYPILNTQSPEDIWDTGVFEKLYVTLRLLEGSFILKKEPLIHFNNLNYTRRQFTEGTQSVTNIYEVPATYLPISENIDHTKTKETKKIEFFYNKTNLAMNFRGNGFFGDTNSEFYVNNLKLYESNMIPFFKYFNENNINTSVQVPLQSISPYTPYINNDEVVLNLTNKGFSSFNLIESNEIVVPIITPNLDN